MGKTRNKKQFEVTADSIDELDWSSNSVEEVKPQQKKVVSPMTKEAISMVNYYCDTILPGFTDGNWYNAACCLRQLSVHLDIEAYRMLGDLMSEMYAGPSTDRVSEVRKTVISALQNQ